MTKRLVFALLVAAMTLGFVHAAQDSETNSETIVATAVAPATVVRIMDAPLPEAGAFSIDVPEPVAAPALAALAIAPISIPRPNFSKGFFEANLVAMVGLNVADYITTRQALKYPGLEEANPLMKPFVKSAAAFAAVKIATTGLTYWSMKVLFKKNRTLAWIMTAATNSLLSVVVAQNLNHIRQARVR